jgi:hypothetical protein
LPLNLLHGCGQRNENAGNRKKSIYERGRNGESLEAVLSDFCGGPASLVAAQ